MLHQETSVIGEHDSHQTASQPAGYQRVDCTVSADGGLCIKAYTLLWLTSRHPRLD